jgi:hypothetical protein
MPEWLIKVSPRKKAADQDSGSPDVIAKVNPI